MAKQEVDFKINVKADELKSAQKIMEHLSSFGDVDYQLKNFDKLKETLMGCLNIINLSGDELQKINKSFTQTRNELETISKISKEAFYDLENFQGKQGEALAEYITNMNKMKEFSSAFKNGKILGYFTEKEVGEKATAYQSALSGFDIESYAKLSSKENLTDEEKAKLAGLEEQKTGIETLKEEYAESKLKALKVSNAESMASNVVKEIGKALKGINETFKTVLGVSISVKENFKDIATLAGQTLQSFNQASMSNSLIVNSQMRTQQITLGLTDAQNFAYSQARGILNIQTIEDLMYLNAEQRNIFSQLMNKYSAWYEEMSTSGSLRSFQELQLDFAIFKQEIAMKFLDWFSQNKTVIYDIMNVSVWLLENIANIVGVIASLLGKIIPNTFSSSLGVGASGINKTTNVTVNVTGGGDSFDTSIENWGSQIAKAVALAVKE